MSRTFIIWLYCAIDMWQEPGGEHSRHQADELAREFGAEADALEQLVTDADEVAAKAFKAGDMRTGRKETERGNVLQAEANRIEEIAKPLDPEKERVLHPDHLRVLGMAKDQSPVVIRRSSYEFDRKTNEGFISNVSPDGKKVMTTFIEGGIRYDRPATTEEFLSWQDKQE